MIVLPAICCWFGFGPVPSGQASGADCLVFLLHAVLLASALFVLLWPLLSLTAPFAVLGVTAIYSLVAICSPS